MTDKKINKDEVKEKVKNMTKEEQDEIITEILKQRRPQWWHSIGAGRSSKDK